MEQARKYWWAIAAAAIIMLAGGGWMLVKFWPHKAANPAAQSDATSSQASPATANIWQGTVDPAAIPLGDGKVSSSPKVGYVDSCTQSFRGGGAQHTGNWIDEARDTWSLSAKVAVEGAVSWPAASYTETTVGGRRILKTNDLPRSYPTGQFPITSNQPAYQYDTNPNHIAAQSVTYTLPLDPTAASSPACVGLGPIGVLSDGVLLYNALDAAGRDAVAHETQDSCNGHPDGRERYHYHNVPSCIRDKATGSSTLVGYAIDGYGIFVERDAKGNLPTNADLDACHGRTSQVLWNGQLTAIYHYDATLEYPYTVGCFHGATAVSASGG